MRIKPINILIPALVLIASPVWAQTKLAPRNAAVRIDNCAPIGRTANGTLVYSMKCETLPVPPPLPQAQVAPEPVTPPEEEVQHSGFLGLSYSRKRPDQ